MCVRPQQCADETLLYWPADGRCYYRMTQGPCYPGALLDAGEDGLANCTVSSFCNFSIMLKLVSLYEHVRECIVVH